MIVTGPVTTILYLIRHLEDLFQEPFHGGNMRVYKYNGYNLYASSNFGYRFHGFVNQAHYSEADLVTFSPEAELWVMMNLSEDMTLLDEATVASTDNWFTQLRRLHDWVR